MIKKDNLKLLTKIIITILFLLLGYSCSVTAGDDKFLVLLNSVSENVQFLDKQGGTLYSEGILSGEIPNQMIKYNSDIIIVNSGSNSIMVFDKDTFNIKREFSIGQSKNPYKCTVKDNIIYITAYLTHQLLIYDYNTGQKIEEINLDSLTENSKTYYPYPQGIVNWNDYIFIACMYSQNNSILKTRDKGRVAIYDINSNLITGYFDSTARDTNNLIVNNNSLYVISSGTYNTGFLEDGAIDKIDLATSNLDSPAFITPTTVINKNSFGVLYIDNENNRAWTGNLGNGTIKEYSTLTETWTLQDSLTFSGNGSMAFISDIQYDKTSNILFVTEFNGNILYEIDAGNLSIITQHRTDGGPLNICIL